MNIKKIRYYQLFSIFFDFILGTILHFTYKWSGNNSLVAIFSSINESVWEHLKLLFFPMLITTIMGSFYFRNKVPNFFCSKVFGIFIAISFTIVFFYTYAGILGINLAIVDISSFFIAVILGEFISYLLIINKTKCNIILSSLFIILMVLFFTVFTFNPPSIGLFYDLGQKNKPN